MDDQKPSETTEGKRLPIKHTYPEGLQTRFVNHFTVQHSERGEFYLSFFEVVPPVFLGEPDEVRRSLDELGEIEARCVARMAVGKDFLQNVIAALAESFGKHLQSKQPESASNESADRSEKKHVG